jgi:DNA-binding winged helix-turn-helix (wHTH) protein
MNRRKLWVLTLVLGLLLLIVGVVVVTRDVFHYRTATRNAFSDSCRRQAVVFEEYAEHWIVRNQLDSLEAAAKLLLMGSGMYVDVTVQGESLYSNRDADLADALLPSPIAPDAQIEMTETRTLAFGAVEVTVPIILTGYPDSSIGILRMAFSGDYANSQIRAHTLRKTGLGFAAWLSLMVGLAFLGWWMQKRHRSIDASILQCGTLRIERDTCEAYLDGQALDLTPKLFALLLFFARQPGVIISDQGILTAIWPDSAYAASADVKQGIYMLRRRLLEAHPDPTQIIVTLKGFGYRFDPPTNEGGLSAS